MRLRGNNRKFATKSLNTELIMCKVKSMYKKAMEGVKAYRRASKGYFYDESETVRQMKKDLYNGTSGFSTDRAKIRSDWRAISGDIKKVFNNLQTGNV